MDNNNNQKTINECEDNISLDELSSILCEYGAIDDEDKKTPSVTQLSTIPAAATAPTNRGEKLQSKRSARRWFTYSQILSNFNNANIKHLNRSISFYNSSI